MNVCRLRDVEGQWKHDMYFDDRDDGPRERILFSSSIFEGVEFVARCSIVAFVRRDLVILCMLL